MTQATTSVTASLGRTKFESEFQTGQGLSRDAAVRLALREATPAADAASPQGSTGILGARKTEVALAGPRAVR
jgi:hypothetical protein